MSGHLLAQSGGHKNYPSQRLNIVKTGTTIQSDLHTHCTPHRNSNGLFCVNGEADPQIHTEFQWIIDRQNNIEND